MHFPKKFPPGGFSRSLRRARRRRPAPPAPRLRPRAGAVPGLPSPRRAARGSGAMDGHYRVVVVGGGVVGASVLYHLAKFGWTDIALVERSVLTAGSSWHAAGGVHALNADPNMAALQAYTIDLLPRIAEESGQDIGLHMTGRPQRRLDPGALGVASGGLPRVPDHRDRGLPPDDAGGSPRRLPDHGHRRRARRPVGRPGGLYRHRGHGPRLRPGGAQPGARRSSRTTASSNWSRDPARPGTW